MREDWIFNKDNRRVRMFITYDAVELFHFLIHLFYAGIRYEVEDIYGCVYSGNEFGYFQVKEGIPAEAQAGGR